MAGEGVLGGGNPLTKTQRCKSRGISNGSVWLMLKAGAAEE